MARESIDIVSPTVVPVPLVTAAGVQIVIQVLINHLVIIIYNRAINVVQVHIVNQVLLNAMNVLQVRLVNQKLLFAIFVPKELIVIKEQLHVVIA